MEKAVRALHEGVVWYRSDLAGQRILSDRDDEFFSAEAARLAEGWSCARDWYSYRMRIVETAKGPG